jgi:phospholipid transport system substrate-binding protein
MFRRLPAGLALGLVLCAAGTASAGPAATRIERLHAAMRAVASEEDLSLAQRKARLVQVVRETYALRSMAAARLGTHWPKLSAVQQGQVAEALAAAVVLDHARATDDGPLTFTAAVEAPEGTVRATMRSAEDGSQALEYRLQAFGADWLVVDRVVDGRGENATEGARYQAAYARFGLAALIHAIYPKPEEPEPAPANETATQVVARLQQTLLTVMQQAKELGFRGRYARLRPVVYETHYIPAIARLTVSRHWGGLSEAQRKQLVDTFGELSVSNYADKFDGYSGERFTQTKEERVGKSTVVRTLLVKSNGETVRLDYTLRQVKGRWRILNITADGVSDLSTKQAEYGSVMSSGGFAALLAKLREQIQRYQSGT